jgi:hypothetical protein
MRGKTDAPPASVNTNRRAKKSLAAVDDFSATKFFPFDETWSPKRAGVP